MPRTFRKLSATSISTPKHGQPFRVPNNDTERNRCLDGVGPSGIFVRTCPLTEIHTGALKTGPCIAMFDAAVVWRNALEYREYFAPLISRVTSPRRWLMTPIPAMFFVCSASATVHRSATKNRPRKDLILDRYERRRDARWARAERHPPHFHFRGDEAIVSRLRDERHHLTRPARRARRVEARAPAHPVRNERDGARLEQEVRQVGAHRRRSDGQVSPARQSRDL